MPDVAAGHVATPGRPQVPFERRCDSCARWHLLPGFTVVGAPEDDENIAAGAKADAALAAYEDDEGKRQEPPRFFEIKQQWLAGLHGDAHKVEESLKPQVLSENVRVGMVARRDKLKVARLHNPLDNWDHISASKERDCHICLTTHSSLWHLHLDLPTCHSCFVGLHRDACPFCGKREPIKSAAMKFCVGCCRSFHRSCEERVRGLTHPAGLCIVCEMQMLLTQSATGPTTPREIMLKKMPTILNFHIFKYKEVFGSSCPGRQIHSGYSNVRAASRGKLDEYGGVKPAAEDSRTSEETRIFRELLSLPTLSSRGGIHTPLSELSRATTMVPPRSSYALSVSSPLAHSSLADPFWDGQHWPMNDVKGQTRQLESLSRGSESMASKSGGRLTRFERRQRSGQIGIQTSSHRTDRVALKPKSSLQELLDYNEVLNRSREQEPQDKLPAATSETPKRAIISVINNGAKDPNASPRKMFSWETRLRTASDRLKQALEDPAPQGVPHPVQKFLSPRANAAYVQQSPRLRTHFLGISPRHHERNCKAKIDCWRGLDRSRMEAGRPPYTSFAEGLEQKYHRALSQVSAYIHDFRSPPTNFAWNQAVANHPGADTNSLTKLGRSGLTDRKSSESAHSPHQERVSPLQSRVLSRGKTQTEKGPSILGIKKKTAPESDFISKGSGGYEEFMKFLNNDVEKFCSEILDMCRSNYTAQELLDAVCNLQLHRHDDSAASVSESEQSSIDEFSPLDALFRLHANVLQEICWCLANKLFLTDETHGVKLTVTQAMLITMRDFGVYPTLLDTRRIFSIVMKAITGCVHGLPESDTRRYQNILQAVILDAALTVFRYDPLNLGVSHAIDVDATDSHMLHVLLIYMKLDERPRVDAFLAQFLSPQEAEKKIDRLTAQKELRNTIAQQFVGESDPIMRTIRRWQHPLQDMFHFFSNQNESTWEIAAASTAHSRIRVIHGSRNMPPKDTISNANKEKMRRINEKRLEVCQTLNISVSGDKKAQAASPVDPRRAALKRVLTLKAYGKVDAAEASYLAECLVEPEELTQSISLQHGSSVNFARDNAFLEKGKKDIEHLKQKERAFQYLISKSSDDRQWVVLEDFIPLCNGDVATAEILFECVKKKQADHIGKDEFVRSLWTDSLCETALKMMSEEEEAMMSPMQDLAGELPRAFQWANEEYLREDAEDTARRQQTLWLEDIDRRIGHVDWSKTQVRQTIDDMLHKLNEEVSDMVGGRHSRQPVPLPEDDLDRLSSSFAQRMSYTSKHFVDVTDQSFLSASQTYPVRRALKTNLKAAEEMLMSPGAKHLLGLEKGMSFEKLLGFEKGMSFRNSTLTNDPENESEYADSEAIHSFAVLSWVAKMKGKKQSIMAAANAETHWMDKDDDVPDLCVSPDSAIGAGSMLKLAQVFGWIGSREQVEQGHSLMEDLDFFELCFRHTKSKSKFQLNWNAFLDMLIDVAFEFVKQSHVCDGVHLDGTTSAYTEGLFIFMGLPRSTITERDWLQKRVNEVLRFRLFDLVGLSAPKTLWLLPLANQPWRDGLHLQNDFRDVGSLEMMRLLNGNISNAASVEAWAELSSSSYKLRRLSLSLGRVPSLSRVPSNAPISRTGSRTDFNSPISRTGSQEFPISRTASQTGASATRVDHQVYFCIMICDSTTDAHFEKHCTIFQAVGWRHALKFFRMDISADNHYSGEFAKAHGFRKFPTIRLYSINGLYREFEGCWDVASVDHWFKSQGLPATARDEEHMDCSSQAADALLQYFEVNDGVGEYLDACLSLKDLTHDSGLRSVSPIKGFPSIFAMQVLTLSSLDLSGPDVFALAQCLKHNRKLIDISLENCRLHGDGLAAVFLALAMNTQIKTLNLSSNVIGVPAPSVKPKVSSLTAMSTERMNQEEHEGLPLSKSVQALADFIRCNASLENLQLRSCGLTDIAIQAMSTSLCFNLILPLAICDLSNNALGDDSVVALMKACETRNNVESSRCKPLQQLNLSGNKITKIGRIWISKYLKDAAANDAHYVNIISSAQKQEPSTESNTSMAPRPEDSRQIENVIARIQDLMADNNLLSLEEKFHMIRLCAGGRKFGWQQSWQLTLPFLRSPLCFRVAQWYFQRLVTVKDKDAYSEHFDEFLKGRAERLYHMRKPLVALVESSEAKDEVHVEYQGCEGVMKGF